MRTAILINSEHPLMININPAMYVAWLGNLLAFNELKYTELNNLYPLYKLDRGPGISLENYIDRIDVYYAPIHPNYSQKSILPFIYASLFLIIYIEKNRECLSGNVFSCIHKLFAAAFQLGAKLFYDYFPTSQQAARVYGINVKELEHIEWDFFARIHGDVRAGASRINPLVVNYLQHLQSAHILRPVINSISAVPTVYPSTDAKQPGRKFHP